MFFRQIMDANHCTAISVTELQAISFEGTKSGILRANGEKAYCCVFTGLEGLFRKDQDEPRRYGRHVCDLVKEEFNSEGFFTSDELPRYGITRAEIRHLYEAMHKTPGDGKLIVMFAYDSITAEAMRQYLLRHFNAEFAASFTDLNKHSAAIAALPAATLPWMFSAQPIR